MSSIVAIEYKAALFYSWSIHYIVNRAPMTSGTKFEYSFDFPPAFLYFIRLFLVTIWEICQIVFDVRFDLADVEGIVDKRKLAVH